MKPKTLKHRVGKVVSEVPTDASSQEVLGEAYTHRRITEVERMAKAGTTPLRRWEDVLELPVALFILPLFAFLNAGIPITGSVLVNAFSDPVALGVLFGLVIGKPIGIVVGVWLGERLGGAQRPLELSKQRLLGVSLLAGVGFTMSTFIANLALGQSMVHLTTVKLAIVMASFVAAMAGYFTLRFASDAD
jgi:NhaA family Na+:H+ antiporter